MPPYPKIRVATHKDLPRPWTSPYSPASSAELHSNLVAAKDRAPLR